jgi:hypothetical protein
LQYEPSKGFVNLISLVKKFIVYRLRLWFIWILLSPLSPITNQLCYVFKRSYPVNHQEVRVLRFWMPENCKLK